MVFEVQTGKVIFLAVLLALLGQFCTVRGNVYDENYESLTNGGEQVINEKKDFAFEEEIYPEDETEQYFVIDRMSNFAEKLENPEKTYIENDDSSTRQRRSLPRKRQAYPKWFRHACRKHFCGSYDCSTFLYAKGKILCKHCRVAACRRGTKILKISSK
ncbi:uncharacterized protein LOC120342022 [Styela clava]